MRASSDSIAQLAGAMARAQMELVNPVKSLTAVLERGRNGSGGLSYRYAPLSAGLDIVRKTLGKQELAVIQTTHVDRERAMVLLTTTIAHGSGEWISAHWPVCHTSDIGHPKLMGAALTYARRYCLFTMVGLAGEEDVDGPDLDDAKEDVAGYDPLVAPMPAVIAQTPIDPSAEPRPRETPAAKRKVAGRTRSFAYTFPRSGDPTKDLARIEDADALFRWVLDILPARNKLDEARRADFDTAFLARADAIGADPELLIAFGPRNVLAESDPGPTAPPT